MHGALCPMPGGAGARPGSPVGHWSFLTPGLSTLPAQFDPKTLDLAGSQAGAPIVGMKDVLAPFPRRAPPVKSFVAVPNKSLVQVSGCRERDRPADIVGWCCPPSAARLAPTDGGWRRWAGVCAEVRKRVYTCGVSQL